MAYTLNPSQTLPYGEGTQFTPNDSNGIVNYSSGYIVMDSSSVVAVVVPIGFHPRKIRIVDVTSAAAYLNNNYAEVELLDFMQTVLANSTIVTKTAATTGAVDKVLDTTGLITVGTDAAGTERTFTISASALQASHTYVFEATA